MVDLLPLEPLPTRLSPLFSVGIHDMDLLSPSPETSLSNGWIACTTDDILADKKKLYDTLITLPPTHSAQAKHKVWPTIKPSSSEPVTPEIKATQRDLRRYRTLRRELRSFSSSNPTTTKSPYPSKHSPNNSTPTLSTENTLPTPFSATTAADEIDDDTSSTHSAQLAEPQSWSALAYNSFMWWASAGENRTDMDEEEDGDALLLPSRQPRADSLGNTRLSKSPGGGGRGGMMDGAEDISGTGRGGIGIEMSIIAYFHRFTAQILKTLADVVDAADVDLVVEAAEVDGHAPSADVDDHDAGGGDAAADSGGTQSSAPGPGPRAEDHADTDASRSEIVIESEDMQRMGLDVWSENDREFARGLVGLYWGRRCVVRGGRFDVCGVRLC